MKNFPRDTIATLILSIYHNYPNSTDLQGTFQRTFREYPYVLRTFAIEHPSNKVCYYSTSHSCRFNFRIKFSRFSRLSKIDSEINSKINLFFVSHSNHSPDGLVFNRYSSFSERKCSSTSIKFVPGLVNTRILNRTMVQCVAYSVLRITATTR